MSNYKFDHTHFYDISILQKNSKRSYFKLFQAFPKCLIKFFVMFVIFYLHCLCKYQINISLQIFYINLYKAIHDEQ